MNRAVRGLLSFFTFLMINFMSYWLVFGQIAPEGLEWLAGTIALLCGLYAAWGVWVLSARSGGGLLHDIFIGAAAIGGTGFVLGFFGPILLGGGNQGPLLGLFITGPLGVVAGAIGGAGWWTWKSVMMQKGESAK